MTWKDKNYVDMEPEEREDFEQFCLHRIHTLLRDRGNGWGVRYLTERKEWLEKFRHCLIGDPINDKVIQGQIHENECEIRCLEKLLPANENAGSLTASPEVANL